jgi:hypothetical protein
MQVETTAVRAARTSEARALGELVIGTHELIIELQECLAAGESFDNPKLTKIADRVFGGSRAQGKYTPRERPTPSKSPSTTTVRETRPRVAADGRNRKRLVSLRRLMQRLPRQTDRT